MLLHRCFTIVILCLAGLSSCMKKSMVDMQDGRLDLRRWDPNFQPVIELRGEWEFHFQDLIEPGSSIDNKELYPWPKAWPSSYGFASYRLFVQLPPNMVGEKLSLYVPFQSTATKIFVNGTSLFESGKVGTSASSSKPSREYRIIDFYGTEELEILVHISNFHHARGGTWYALKLGMFKDVVESRFRRQIVDSFLIFTLLGLGFFFMLSYAVNQRLVNVAIGLTGLTNALRYAMTSERLLEDFIPLPFNLGMRLEYWSLYLLFESYILFVYIYLNKLFSKLMAIFFFTSAMAINLKVFASPLFFSQYLFLAHILCIISICYSFYISFKGRRDGIRGSIFIFYGSIGILVASTIDITLVTLSQSYDFYVIQFGSLVFLYMQAMAAGARELNYVQKIKYEQQMRNHSYDQLRKIVYPHQMAIIQEGGSLEQTMPTNLAQACVISMDIINSSKIQHEKVKEFLRATFLHCTEEMMVGYDPKSLKANAYRIKELGDGFLCSVGYPFKSLSGSMANDALLLAYRFFEILQEQARILQSDQAICCGLGIALDAINGFYPESGAKEYDVFGPSIILATRYESMRKHLQDEYPNHSLIILQERVYQSLDRRLRKGFLTYNLSENNTQVRDDAAAKRFYFRPLNEASHLYGKELNSNKSRPTISVAKQAS
ncbi:MAG: 7TM diverse intracellular signaling domain-containing protein [Oligoflexus sp.]